MPTRRWLAAALCALTLVGAGAPAASADTADELRDAKRRAAQLTDDATTQRQAATDAQSRLLALSAAANEALAQAERTARAVEAARAEAAGADEAVAAAREASTNARQLVQDYARNAYIAGGSTGELGSLMSLVQSGAATEMLDGLALLDQVGGSVADALANLREAERDEQAAAQQVRLALAGLQRAEQQMRAARLAAQRAVAQQREVLADAKARAVAVAQQAEQAKQTTRELQAELQAEIAAARARALTDTGLAKCNGDDISGYPNGQIPVEMLCPLYGAPAEALRQDAAAQFNAMSRAFEQEFGSPICVADSYRSYERQQQTYQERPGYAATPGTSEHGWARAVDLCGGIERDGTPQNTWLRLNAAQYNWFHPGWADAGGGGPYEPWHWEYAG